jgi:hypothetical protein
MNPTERKPKPETPRMRWTYAPLIALAIISIWPAIVDVTLVAPFMLQEWRVLLIVTAFLALMN